MKAATLERETSPPAVETRMRAAVYRGKNQIAHEQVAGPEIHEGELLVRVHTCGVCGTDLKKIEYGLADPPRIFGHEIAGTVVRAGAHVKSFSAGDRVALHHHIPCRSCFYCRRKLFSQCAFYRRTGTTAGFEPAGGGFAEYVRVMNWIVAEGAVASPEGISFREAFLLGRLHTLVQVAASVGRAMGEAARCAR